MYRAQEQNANLRKNPSKAPPETQDMNTMQFTRWILSFGYNIGFYRNNGNENGSYLGL